MVNRAEQHLTMLLLQIRPDTGKLKPIPKGEIASKPKLKVKAFFSELLIFLGWLLNTRALLIPILGNKYKASVTQSNEI